MRRFGRKPIVVAAAVLGIVVLALAVIAGKDRLLERWYLLKLASEDLETRKTAAERLGELGSVRAIPELLRTMREHSSVFGGARPKDLEYLELWGPHEDASALACFQAVRSIAGAPGRQTTPYLLAALRESETAFATFRGPITEEQAEEVAAQLIMMALANAREAARPAVPAIRRFLEEREPKSFGSRAAAVFALGEIHPGGEEVFRLLAAVLTTADEAASVRCAAADALGKIGQYHAEAPAVLETVQQDEDARVREYASRALKRIRAAGAAGE